MDKQFNDLTPVDSGHLHSAGYNSVERIMTVRFKNGYVYHVHGVPAEEYSAFMGAPSQGEYYHQFIKDNYHVERVK